ncbi:hypothetical protein, partial [Brucella sp. CMUL 015]|uniref:hypothetical protein n=1 Tax=Brucella sp. CMUL 015 TaxID=1905697 RepID=UPI001AEC771A
DRQGLFAMGETDFDQMEAAITTGEAQDGKKQLITMDELKKKVAEGKISKDDANQLVKLGRVAK